MGPISESYTPRRYVGMIFTERLACNSKLATNFEDEAICALISYGDPLAEFDLTLRGP